MYSYGALGCGGSISRAVSMLVGPEGPDCVLHIQRVEGVDGSEVQTPSTLTQYKNTSMEPPLGATPGESQVSVCIGGASSESGPLGVRPLGSLSCVASDGVHWTHMFGP